MDYGIQMYSLRDITKDDLEGALGKVAAMGYKFIEFAGFFDHTADEINAYLKKNDLTLVATHSSFADLLTKYDETIAYHKAIGNTRYIVPGYDLSTKEKLDTFIEQVKVLAPKMRAEGIELGFHNHSGEFRPNKDGLIVEEELYKRTDIFFELDTYWSYVAGRDSVKTMEWLGDRLKMVHLKDGDPNGKGCSLGSGTCPVAEIRAKSIEMGCIMVVESEGLDPTGVEEVKRCIDYLRTLD